MSPSSNLDSTFTLSDGSRLPAIGLGTFQGESGNSRVEAIILAALRQHGYRHIDTAAAYGNEKEIGRAIRESGIPRHELYVTTKLAQTWHNPSDVAEALEQSLKDLQLDYVPHAYAAADANHSTLRHSSGNGKPVIDYELSRAYPEVWKAMEGLVDNGKAKSIGLSNFNLLKMKRILEVARIRPVANQIELHPYFPQHQILDFCRQEGIHLIAHQPLGGKPVGVVNPNASRSGPLLDPQIAEIARECTKSPAQVILSWAVQRGTAVVPRTAREDRLAENADLFRLSDEQFMKIDHLTRDTGTVRFLDPSAHIGFDVFNELADEPVSNRAPWDQ